MTREQTRLNKMIKAEKKEEKKKIQKDQPKKAPPKRKGKKSSPTATVSTPLQLQSKEHQSTTKTRSFSGPPRFPKGNTFERLKL